MRRKDKEITDEAQIRGILERGKVCRVAFFDEGY
ncbi:MAG: pyridoxamine 5'-phosphate oxidase family protein, partial [Thermovirga sp.]|nr:pyridoxamine 5'-phosphate oxidase family protein [Thermovirga sp.]